MIGLDFHLMQQEDWTTTNYETYFLARMPMMDAFGVSGPQWLLMSFIGLLFLIVITSSRMGRSAAPSASAAVHQS
ncbi:hypothetical protein [Paenibacillus dendritiformis]|uniref:hypothetical protein n=1 Tax=Paenibacillus dendritiformis TaxID=130049 RepID=UPI000DA81FB1|nr:hypothetical protein [Paenibacillus dendritiformis]PZM62399.1 hypothetical protein DOE73_27450 [Paenibacillus dendritiformis]